MKATLNKIMDKLSETIVQAADESIPKIYKQVKNKKHTPWWNQECEEAIKMPRKRSTDTKNKTHLKTE